MVTRLLTGIPRSGTTLACALLNEYDDTVALVEPIQFGRTGGRAQAVDEIAAFAVDVRERLLRDGSAPTFQMAGAFVENTMGPPVADRLRQPAGAFGTVKVEKALTPGFTLIIKHPGEFTALADLLVERFALYAIVRNPLDVLAGWQTVALPVNQGRMPAAEALSPLLAGKLDASDDPLERQIALLEWMLETYRTLPPRNVLRYEDFVVSPQTVLAPLSEHARAPSLRRQAYDPAARYPGVDLAQLAERLRPLRSLIEHFYPEAEHSPWERRPAS